MPALKQQTLVSVGGGVMPALKQQTLVSVGGGGESYVFAGTFLQ